jgi:GntR family transcriptional regulator
MSYRPPYQVIADVLRAQIGLGQYGEGGRLPSTRQLAEEHNVERATVTKAINLLEAEGLVLVEHGRGVFVRGVEPRRRLVRDRVVHRDERGYYFDQTAKNWVAVEPPTIKVGLPPEDVSALLEISAEDQTLIRDRRMGEKGSAPYQLATSYIPLRLASGTALEQPNTGPGGIYDRMQDMGHELHWVEAVTARMPTPEEAQVLRVVPGVPLLRVLRTTLNQRNRPLEVNDTRMAADRFELSYPIHRPEQLPE